ncbi:MAG TPA: RNA-binding S4 domain-containing protein [Rhodanobacteraceae bacterium]
MAHPACNLEAHAAAGVRLDTWLWAARFFRTRSLAKRAVETGRVELDGRACKPAHALRVGAMLRITRDEECFEIEVLRVSDRRGPASVAQTLYRESEASRAARETAREQRRAERAGYRPPAGKPDKRARRLIRALGDIDAI